MKHPVNVKMHEERTFGQRAADAFTTGFGTWTYILIQTAIIIVWMAGNAAYLAFFTFDKYPFILLNLGFSAQASYAAPLILMASNRQAARDRMTLEHQATETDAIFGLQNQQIEILNAIKAETALLQEIHRHLDPNQETPV